MQDLEVVERKTKENHKKPFLYFVYGGNFPEMIAGALRRRGNWAPVNREEECVEKCHFVFRPFNYNTEQYKRIDRRLVRNGNPFVFNHLEYVRCLTTKSGLVRSLKHYYSNNNVARQANYSVFSTMPTTFLLSAGQKDAEATDFTRRYLEI